MILGHLSSGMGGRYEPCDYEEGTVGADPAMLDPAKVAACHAVLVVFENGPIRARVDGIGNPSSTLGLQRLHRTEEALNVGEAAKLRMVRTGATNGTFRATYYRVA